MRRPVRFSVHQKIKSSYINSISSILPCLLSSRSHVQVVPRSNLQTTDKTQLYLDNHPRLLCRETALFGTKLRQNDRDTCTIFCTPSLIGIQNEFRSPENIVPHAFSCLKVLIFRLKNFHFSSKKASLICRISGEVNATR